eukprot:symbB.v1.2.005144.t1/scaffold226.1/size261315/23
MEDLPCFPDAQVDLLLAPPPLERLKRLLPQLVQLGVNTLALCRVPGADREVFHCHLLRQAQKLHEVMLPGLEQSGFTQVPVIQEVQMETFLAKDCWENKLRPTRSTGGEPLDLAANGRVLVAIGPEQGWQRQEEDLLRSFGFRDLCLGPRKLSLELQAMSSLALCEAAKKFFAASMATNLGSFSLKRR